MYSAYKLALSSQLKGFGRGCCSVRPLSENLSSVRLFCLRIVILPQTYKFVDPYKSFPWSTTSMWLRDCVLRSSDRLYGYNSGALVPSTVRSKSKDQTTGNTRTFMLCFGCEVQNPTLDKIHVREPNVAG